MSSNSSSSSVQPTIPPRLIANAARAAAARGVYLEGFTQGQIKIKDEKGEEKDAPIPLYKLGKWKPPLPDRIRGLSMTLQQYRDLPAHKFHELSTVSEKEAKEIRNLLFDLIFQNVELWTKRGVKVFKKHWEEIAVDMYCRKAILLKVEVLRTMWKTAKDSLRKMLKECIKDKRMHETSTETHLDQNFPGYLHIRFYRTTLQPYEDQLRAKYNGLEADEEEIRAFENDEDVIIEYEDVGHQTESLAVVKTEPEESTGNQESTNFAPPPPSFHPLPTEQSGPSFPSEPLFSPPLPPTFFFTNPCPTYPTYFMPPTSEHVPEQEMKVHHLSQLQHLQYGSRSSVDPVDTSSPRKSANNPIRLEDTHQAQPVDGPEAIAENNPLENGSTKDTEHMIEVAGVFTDLILHRFQRNPHARRGYRQIFHEFCSFGDEVPYKKLDNMFEDCERASRTKRRITDNRLKNEEACETKRPRQT
ncbi:hypothetical protein GCK72_006764 [Caenorhabditis remanei]|uniref:MADF domain-containing protein n=1 Tax=Caenorhabditis remanei TaxID=31234 RepID=A0A6A5HJF0_CAERE|nr:hypothetical protein GCK72_006764 [Caenorhabditis remanei]KAF1766806.1 hypothetical protein GCK72_006764 [Caenorhabditis remanei]